jgi:tetratricopeptide (TPR) repeat protein
MFSFVGNARAQEWISDYADGKEALRKGSYRQAVVFFSKAIDQRPESKADARTRGVQFVDYFPYVYRGIAYAQMGNRKNALKDFEREHAAGEVYKGQRDVEAGRILRKRLDEFRGGTTPSQTIHAPTQGSDLDSMFTTASLEFGRRNLSKSKTILQQLRQRRPAYPGLDTSLARIRALELDVKKGIAAFLNGRYRDATESLGPVAARWNDNVTAHAFLGCSHAGLYLLSGERKDEERTQAINAFRHVKGLDPAFNLNRPYISPAIQDMFASVQAGSVKGSNP